MSNIKRFSEPVILIGGGPVSKTQIDLVAGYSQIVIAADSGADKATALGLDVVAVYGDMDSLSADYARNNGHLVNRVSEQDSGDFEKCIYSTDSPFYLGVGFLGGRLDHELASLNVLAKYPDRRILLVGEQDITLLCPRDFSINLPAATRVSVFPMGKVTGLTSEGLKWRLLGGDMASEGRIGTSNQANGPCVKISYSAGALLLILPIKMLSALIEHVLPQ